MALGTSLVNAIGEAENFGFHHMEYGTPEYQHWTRLVELTSHVAERLADYDYIKKSKVPTRREGPTAQEIMDRYLDFGGYSGHDSRRLGSDGDAESIRQARLDAGEDNC